MAETLLTCFGIKCIGPRKWDTYKKTGGLSGENWSPGAFILMKYKTHLPPQTSPDTSIPLVFYVVCDEPLAFNEPVEMWF